MGNLSQTQDLVLFPVGYLNVDVIEIVQKMVMLKSKGFKNSYSKWSSAQNLVNKKSNLPLTSLLNNHNDIPVIKAFCGIFLTILVATECV